mmetsp:Transcript_1275/g.4938  ORF Transcript_1275/g.4938 Transcript_1275/m.4938 type:complete len:225 (-) Transcript_1275:1073-1747(-)
MYSTEQKVCVCAGVVVPLWRLYSIFIEARDDDRGRSFFFREDVGGGQRRTHDVAGVSDLPFDDDAVVSSSDSVSSVASRCFVRPGRTTRFQNRVLLEVVGAPSSSFARRVDDACCRCCCFEEEVRPAVRQRWRGPTRSSQPASDCALSLVMRSRTSSSYSAVSRAAKRPVPGTKVAARPKQRAASIDVTTTPSNAAARPAETIRTASPRVPSVPKPGVAKADAM